MSSSKGNTRQALPFEFLQTLQSRDQVESSGIGLALVKKIVEAQGGRVSVDAAPGRGSTFTFTWPKELGALRGQPPPAAEPSHER